jgi:hypothetical protein
MTLPEPGSAPALALTGGVDVDAVAAVVCGCAGVAGLDGGRFGEVASYLPGRTVAGVVVSGGRVLVQVRSRWGVPAPALAGAITRALRPVTGDRPVDVVIADIDDPPSAPGKNLPPPPTRGTRPREPSGRSGEGLTFQSGCES